MINSTPIDKQNCDNCYASRPYDKHHTILRCHYQPPDITNRWPVVSDTDWCSFWYSKENQ